MSEKRAVSYADLRKFNPYHDSRGRFSTANGSKSFTYAPGKSKAHDLAIAREKERQAAIDASQKKKLVKKPSKPKELTTEKEFNQHAKKYKEWEDSLTDSEKDVIGRYETESFAFNHKLRNGDPKDYDTFAFGKQATVQEYKALDSALDKSKVQDDVVVFRAISDKNALGDLSKLTGATITDNGYASTSLNKDMAMMYGDGIICKINVKKGASGAYISGIKDGNGKDFTENREILLPRGAKFKIQNVTKRDDGAWEVEMDYEG